MKKYAWVVAIGCLLFSRTTKAQDQEVQQLLLNVEKLAQFKALLSNLKESYEVLYNGYNRVKGIAAGHFELHDQFLASLLEASPAVRQYHRVGEIIQSQLLLVKEARASLRRFQNSGVLLPEELAYLQQVHTNLLARSLRGLEALTSVLTAGKYRMSDSERLQAIDAIWNNMTHQTTFLRAFDKEAALLLLQRQRAAAETEHLKKLYSIKR